MFSGVLYTWCYCYLPVPPRPIPQPSTDDARCPTGTLLFFFQPFQICYLNAKIAAIPGLCLHPSLSAAAAWQQNNGSCCCSHATTRLYEVQQFKCFTSETQEVLLTRDISDCCAICTTEGKTWCCLMVAQLKVKKALISSYTPVSRFNWVDRGRAKIIFTHSYLGHQTVQCHIKKSVFYGDLITN